MLETLLILGCLAVFTAFGYPFVLWLPIRTHLLAAPAMGVAVISASCTALAYLSLTVTQVVPWMWIALILCIGVVAWRRRDLPKTLGEDHTQGLPKFVLGLGVLLGIIHLGWPYIQVGHETFLAYVNPDGWSYLCGADFLRENTKADVVDAWMRPSLDSNTAWAGGSVNGVQLWTHPWLVDCTQTVVQRIGQYLLLGFFAETLSFEDSFYVLIPVSLAIVIASAGPLFLLARAGGLPQSASAVAALIWLCSPVVAFSFYYTFFSQQIGLCLGPLALAITIYSRQKGVCANLSLMVVWSGLWSCYPEIVLFIGLFAVLLALASEARVRELARVALLSVAGVLLLNHGAFAVLGFLYQQTMGGVDGANRPGEGVFPFGATFAVLPFWMGLIINLLLDHALLIWAAVISVICVPVLAVGWWQARGLRLAIGGLSIVGLLIWAKLAWLDDYPYAATKVALFTAWLIPLGVGGVWSLSGRWSYLPALRLGVVALFLIAGLLQGRIFGLRSFPTPGSSLMDLHFSADETLADLRGLFDGEEGRAAASREGVMVDVRGWSDTLWVCYWLRDMELGLWRAQPLYIGRDVNSQEDHHQFHARSFTERYLLRDLKIDDVLKRDLAEPLRSVGRFGLFAFEKFYDWDHAERDEFPFPRLGRVEASAQGTCRRVWKKVRLRCVRLGETQRRLRMHLAPVTGPVRIEVKVDGKMVQEVELTESTEFTISDLPFDPDGIHILSLEVVGAEERSFTDPADFVIRSMSIQSDAAWAQTYPREVDLLDATMEGLTALRAVGIYTDLWSELESQLSLRTAPGDQRVVVKLEVPGVVDREDCRVEAWLGEKGEFGRVRKTLVPGRSELSIPIQSIESLGPQISLYMRFAGGVKIEPDTRKLFARIISVRIE